MLVQYQHSHSYFCLWSINPRPNPPRRAFSTVFWLSSKYDWTPHGRMKELIVVIIQQTRVSRSQCDLHLKSQANEVVISRVLGLSNPQLMFGSSIIYQHQHFQVVPQVAESINLLIILGFIAIIFFVQRKKLQKNNVKVSDDVRKVMLFSCFLPNYQFDVTRKTISGARNRSWYGNDNEAGNLTFEATQLIFV